MKLLPVTPSFILSFLLLCSSALGEENSKKNVFATLIKPVLEAKCVQCHGAEKDKGKLRLHTKEDLLKGGREVGEDILIKGNIEDSELIYRITLPKEDDESMPPFDDKDHYNPVTPQELKVMQAWIKMGVSFDLLVKDLDESSRKAAEHVFKNMPKKILSVTAKLQQKLPQVPPADPKALSALREKGLLALPIAQNTNTLYVNASYAGKSFDDQTIKLLEPIAKQLLWLNLARTAVTDKGIATMQNFSLLTRLHLENTAVTDGATAHLAKLSNLEYLNLYGTEVSDASIENLAKLRKLSKVFLWQTKFTNKGAVALKKRFVEEKVYNTLKNEIDKLKTSLEKTTEVEKSNLAKLEAKKLEIGKKTTDVDSINEKCPVSNKDLDETKNSIFEGRKIGFCCDKCKAKFDAKPASFLSKIKGFKSSEEFTQAKAEESDAKEKSGSRMDAIQVKMSKASGQLKQLGPEINMGWAQPVESQKK